MHRLAALLLAAAALHAAVGAAPIRTLIFSGQNNHGWRTTTPYLENLLTACGRFEVRVEEEPAGLTAATLAHYDLIVVDYQGPRWGDSTERAVADFVGSGKGLVAVHGSSYAFSGLDILGPGHVRTGRTEPPWLEWAAMLGGTWAGDPPRSFHAPRHLFTVKFTDPSHPIRARLGQRLPDIGRTLPRDALPPGRTPRSEEHTSELQSLRHLVCRLLLEKKK